MRAACYVTYDRERDVAREVLLGGDLTLVRARVFGLHVVDAQVPFRTFVFFWPVHGVAGVRVVHVLADGDGVDLVELLPHHL